MIGPYFQLFSKKNLTELIYYRYLGRNLVLIAVDFVCVLKKRIFAEMNL